jgi:flagellar M-ring protein FliF
MAAQGLPQGGGIGMEIFDNTKLGMTEFVQNVNYQRALQGELSRTINDLEEVEGSRVHIVMAAKSLFIEDQEPATASVVLKLKPGRHLSREQVEGIVHLVSASVSGLKPENVTVVDNSGKILAGLEDELQLGRKSIMLLEYQQKVERNIENKIKSMLENALGPSRVIVRASCDFDFRQREMTEERFDPQNKVVRSEKKSSEIAARPDQIPMGVPGKSAYTTPDATNSTAGIDLPAIQKQNQMVNYEIGKVTSHVVEPAARLVKTSVAVIVDGTYKKVSGADGKVEMQYVARKADELKQLENIVKRAINFDPGRGDEVVVENMPFDTEPWQTVSEEKEKAPGWMAKLNEHRSLVKYGIAGFILFFTFLFVIRPLVRWLTGGSGQDVQLLQQLPKTVGEIENEYERHARNLPYSEQASRLVMRDNTASVQLIREWMKES